MEKLVIYQSQTGFTEQYARWIAQALHCEAKPLKGISTQELLEPEELIYGGWLMANRIQGLDKIKKVRKDRLSVFGVGASPYSQTLLQTLRDVNFLCESVPLFYMQGGIRLDQLGLFQRTALKALGKSLEKKADKTPEELEMAQALEHGSNPVKMQFIQPLVVALGGTMPQETPPVK